MFEITLYDDRRVVHIEDEPTECPICHRQIVPEPIYAFSNLNGTYEFLFRCNNRKCSHIFIATYNNSLKITQLNPQKPKPIEINEDIKTISPNFYKIFAQANESECMSFDEITGVGYRKALEFLIKDYCINKNRAEEDKIKRLPLMQVINSYMNEAPKLKSCAERAVWLGNDETHYERKWENKDINDLKLLIKLTLHHIEAEILTEKFEAEMGK